MNKKIQWYAFLLGLVIMILHCIFFDVFTIVPWEHRLPPLAMLSLGVSAGIGLSRNDR